MSMSDLTQLSDDDLRTRLFDALVERIDAKIQEDPSIAVVTRMPAVLGVTRHENLLTLSQGVGIRLLRGVLKWRDPRKEPRTFDVRRATIGSRLAITPDGLAGAPDDIVEWVVATFLEQTVASEAAGPTSAPRPESRAPARAQQNRSTPREAPPRRAAAATSTQERRPAVPRTRRETRPPAGDVTQPAPRAGPPEPPPTPQTVTKPSEAQAPPPSAATIRPPLRTYQLLFEIAQRELNLASALPAGRSTSFLIGAGVFVGLTVEAFFNDLGTRVMSSWAQLERLEPREKAEVLNIELFKTRVDWNVRPFESVAAVLGFRRALEQAHAETLVVDQVGTTDGSGSRVPQARQPRWQDHCDVATMQRWVTDIRYLIEHFSRAHDATSRGEGVATQQSGSPGNRVTAKNEVQN